MKKGMERKKERKKNTKKRRRNSSNSSKSSKEKEEGTSIGRETETTTMKKKKKKPILRWARETAGLQQTDHGRNRYQGLVTQKILSLKLYGADWSVFTVRGALAAAATRSLSTASSIIQR